jgi:flagellar biosynthesis/type III secretory pathway protein FliH
MTPSEIVLNMARATGMKGVVLQEFERALNQAEERARQCGWSAGYDDGYQEGYSAAVVDEGY